MSNINLKAMQDPKLHLMDTTLRLYLHANVRLGWKGRKVRNTLAYYNTDLIKAVKNLIVTVTRAQYLKNLQT
jgi:hypothetical protein